MRADWYIDPLGRFEGRFFDGEKWTNKVSDGGLLAVDPNWAQPQTEPEPEQQLEPDPEAEPEPELEPDAEAEPEPEPEPEQEPEPKPDVVAATTGPKLPLFAPLEPDPPTVDSVFDGAADEPAVRPALAQTGPGDVAEPIGASGGLLTESPVRAVAVVGDSPTDLAERAVDDTRRWWMYAIGTLALVVGAALLVVPVLLDDDDDAVEPSAAEEPAAATNGASGDEPAVSQTEIDVASLGDDIVDVGSTIVVNGSSTIDAVADWHDGFLARRGLTAEPGSSCWFAELESVFVETLYCGPVAGSAGGDAIFDMVPLELVDVAPGVVEVQADLDATTPDSFAPAGLELFGTVPLPGPPEPQATTESRGERSTGD